MFGAGFLQSQKAPQWAGLVGHFLGVAIKVAPPAYADRAAAQAQTARPKKGPAQLRAAAGLEGPGVCALSTMPRL